MASNSSETDSVVSLVDKVEREPGPISALPFELRRGVLQILADADHWDSFHSLRSTGPDFYVVANTIGFRTLKITSQERLELCTDPLVEGHMRRMADYSDATREWIEAKRQANAFNTNLSGRVPSYPPPSSVAKLIVNTDSIKFEPSRWELLGRGTHSLQELRIDRKTHTPLNLDALRHFSGLQRLYTRTLPEDESIPWYLRPGQDPCFFEAMTCSRTGVVFNISHGPDWATRSVLVIESSGIEGARLPDVKYAIAWETYNYSRRPWHTSFGVGGANPEGVAWALHRKVSSMSELEGHEERQMRRVYTTPQTPGQVDDSHHSSEIEEFQLIQTMRVHHPSEIEEFRLIQTMRERPSDPFYFDDWLNDYESHERPMVISPTLTGEMGLIQGFEESLAADEVEDGVQDE